MPGAVSLSDSVRYLRVTNYRDQVLAYSECWYVTLG